MADDKVRNIYDSITDVDGEESLEKAKGQESLSGSEAREEHFKQNIMMDVTDRPDGVEVVKQSENQIVIEEATESTNQTVQEKAGDPVVDADLNRTEYEDRESDQQTLSNQANGVVRDSVEPSGVINQENTERSSSSGSDNQSTDKFSAFEQQSVDQQIEEALIGTPDNPGDKSNPDADLFGVSDISDIDASANQISEVASIGDVVGVTAFASDENVEDDVAYSLSVNPNNAFAIDANTGEVTVADPTGLDFESATTMLIEVTATSSDGSTSIENFNIVIGDENEFSISTVVDSDNTTNEVSESAVAGASVGVTAFASDADGSNNDVIYSLSSNPGNAFAIDPNTGEVTVANSNGLDFESSTSIQIEVTAASQDGSTSSEIFNIAINDANEFDISAVTDSDNTANEVSESAVAGVNIGVTAFASDADGTNSDVTYSLSSNPGNAFSIDANTGEVTVNDPSQLDFENNASMQIEVTATSQDGSTSSEIFDIAINDADEFDVSAVTDSDNTTNEVSESAVAGASVGMTAFASDADGTNSDISYSLSSNPGNAFAIDVDTGEVTVANPGALDFENAQSMQIEVTATSDDGSTSSESFNIAINDADEFDVSAVTDSDNTTNEVSESAIAGASVGVTAFASDADGTNSDVSYSLSSNPGNAFSIDAITGEVTVNDPSQLDFENSASMQIEVTATSTDGSTSSESFNIVINDEDEFDVSAVTDTDAATNEVSESASAGASVGVTAFASDADGTNSDVSYSLSSNPGNAFAIDVDTGEITVNDSSQLDFENSASMQIEVTATSDDGSSSSESFNIAINDADEFDVSVVTDNDNTTNEVSESAAAGASIGVTAFAQDQDGTNSDVTYTLSSNPGNAFSIDANTGEVTVNDPSQLDFENAQSMQIEVTATSQDGSTSSETFNIAINDADEFDVSTVVDSDVTTNEVSESASVGTSVGVTAFASDADGTNSDVTYTLSSNPGNAFSIDTTTGEVTVNDPNQLDFENSASMQIEVTATSQDGSTSSETFNIAINDADEFDVSAVTDSDATTNEVSENAAVGASVGVTAFASDADGTNSDITYSLSSNPNNAFAIDPNTGEVTVVGPNGLDFETATTMQIEVTAISTDGSTSTETFNIAINDADELDVSAVTDTDVATNEISESAVAGASVGVTAFASDADGTDSVTYSLSSNPNNAFAIDANTGEVIVNDPSQLDFESSQTMQIEVTATSTDGSTSTETFDIAINDADEFDVSAVTDTDVATNEIGESASVGASVGVTAFASDADGTDSVTYFLSSNPNNAFAIDPGTGEVTVVDPNGLDFETATSMQIEVTATSTDGSTSTETFNITINDADEFDVSAVTDTDAATNEVSESASAGANVGVTAFASDADGSNNTVSYSLTNNPNNAFAIDPNTGEVTVADPSGLDFETATNMQIEVTATSTDASTSSETFNIAINDADEFDVSAVTDSDNTANEISESAAAGTSVGVTAFASDADGSNSDVSYSLSSNPGGAFSIDVSTGEVTVNDPSQLDFESSQTMQIEVTATSTDGSTSTETFNIAINDADEFDVSTVTDTDTNENAVSESAVAGASVGVTAFASDADGSNSDVTYSLSNDAGGAFTIDPNTGEVTVADPNGLDFETVTTMQIEVTATSDDGSTSTQTFNIAINDADEFDVSAVTDSDASTNEISESATAGTSVGITAFAEDQDGTNSDVSYSLSANPGDAFSIDASTGEVTVNDPSQLDFESSQTMQIDVTATSDDGSTSTQTFNIAINDADEFDVSAVTDSDASTNEISESETAGASVGVTAFAEDQDGSNSDVAYSLSNDAGGAFTIDASTGEVTVNDPSQLDFESSQTMQIDVTATSDDGSTSTQTFNIAINDADEFDVSAVTDTDVANNEVSESAVAGISVGVTAFASDADGSNNDVTYSLSNDAGGAFSIDASTGEVTVNDPSQLDFETLQTMQIEVTATSDDGSTSTQIFDIAINDADEFDVSAVTDTDAATNEVSESAVVGASVGVTAFASDADGTNSDVVYSLSSNPSNAFSIDASTGEVTVNDPSQLDFESSQTMQIEVTATSDDGSTSTQTFNIAINDADEFDVSAVTDSDATADQVVENAANGTTVGVTALASDQDGADSVTYSLSNDAGGRFTIDSATGEISVADGSLLNHEVADSHNVTVMATSSDGSTSNETFTINVADVNEAPTDIRVDLSLSGEAEFQVNTTTASTQDDVRVTALADGGYVAVWESTFQDGDGEGIYLQRYDATGNTVGGETLVNTTTDDYQFGPEITSFEDGGFAVVWVSVGQDGDRDGVFLQRFDAASNTVGGETQVNTNTVGDQDELSIAALSDGGFVVGWASNGQDGSGEGIYFQRYDDAGNTVGGETQINTTTTGDQETINIAALDDGGFVVVWESDGQDGSGLGVYLQRYDDAGNTVGSETQVNTTTAGGQDDAAITVLTDGGFVVAWESDGQDGDGNGVYMQRYDAEGNTVGGETQVNTTTLGYQNDPEVAALPSGGFIVTWESFGQDGDGSGVYMQRYDVEGNTVGGEEIINTVTSGGQLDASITVLNDGSVAVFWESENIDGDGRAVVGRIFTPGVDEDAADGTVVATLNTSDPDSGDTHTYAIVDGSGDPISDSNFEIVGNEIRVKSGANLDYENTTSHDLNIEVTDSGGLTHTEVVTINVNDVNEFDVSAVADSDSATNEVSESTTVGASVGVTAFAQDQDGANSDVAYSLSNNPNNAFAIDSNTGEVTVADPSQLDFETVQTMQIEVTATSMDGSTSTQTFDIAINDADEFDVSAVTDSDGVINEVSESATAGTSVGVTAFAQDQDGADSITYSLSNNPNNAFAIDASTGEVTVADPSELDFETATSMQIEVTATSTDGSNSTQTFDIAINDENEAPSDIALSNQSDNLVYNGSFESGSTGWSSNDGNVEVSTDGTYNVVGADGSHVMELDGSSSNVDSVYQDIATTSGQVYDLSLDVAARHATSLETNTVEVYWNGELIETIEPSSTTFETHAFQVIGTGGNDRLEFREPAGDDDSLGGVIDNVSLTGLSEVMENVEVMENSEGNVIGTLTTTDADVGDTHSYTVSDARFEVVDDGNGNQQLKLKDGVSLNYEDASSVTVTVTSTDSGGLSTSEDFTINVNDINEAATDLNFTGNTNVSTTSTVSIVHGVTDTIAAGTVVATVSSVIDPDNGDTHTFALTDDANGMFQIDANTGEISLTNSVDANVNYSQQSGASNPFDGIDVGSDANPAFVDIDNDGDLDAFIGEHNGNINYFENTGDSTNPNFVQQSGVDNPLDGIDVGQDSSPEFVDIDNDGDLDIFVGERSYDVNSYENTGDSVNPNFVSQTGADDPFDGIGFALEADVSFADLDNDGDLDAVVGGYYGEFNYYENTGDSADSNFVKQTGADNPFDSIDVGYGASPTLTDVDGDGDLDMVSGNENGQINYFENTGDSANPTFVQQTGADNPFDHIDVGDSSTPTFADVDGDGDQDVFIGDEDGNISYYENNQGVNSQTISVEATDSDGNTYVEDVGVHLGTNNSDNITGGSDSDIIYGFDGDDNIEGGLGDDMLYGEDGNDIFNFDVDSGADYVDGGAGGGWVDSIDLSDVAANAADPSSPWQIEVDGEQVDYDIDAGSLELGVDVSGVIQFDDGSQINFDNLESIEW